MSLQYLHKQEFMKLWNLMFILTFTSFYHLSEHDFDFKGTWKQIQSYESWLNAKVS